jgi:hypothetical protein
MCLSRKTSEGSSINKTLLTKQTLFTSEPWLTNLPTVSSTISEKKIKLISMAAQTEIVQINKLEAKQYSTITKASSEIHYLIN